MGEPIGLESTLGSRNNPDLLIVRSRLAASIVPPSPIPFLLHEGVHHVSPFPLGFVISIGSLRVKFSSRSGWLREWQAAGEVVAVLEAEKCCGKGGGSRRAASSA